jgi:hypothetical protein
MDTQKGPLKDPPPNELPASVQPSEKVPWIRADELWLLPILGILLIAAYAVLSLVLLAFGVKLPSLDGIYRVITSMGER